MPNAFGRLTDEEYQTAYSLVPRACIDLVVIDQQRSILLTLRDIEPNKGKWHFPGGRLKKDEPINDSIIRISRDELGESIVLGDPLLIGYLDFIPDGQLPNGIFLHSVSIVFLVHLQSGKVEGDFQSSKIQAFKPSNLPSIEEMLPQHGTMLQKLVENKMI